METNEVELVRYSPSKIKIVTHEGKKTAQLLCFNQIKKKDSREEEEKEEEEDRRIIREVTMANINSRSGQAVAQDQPYLHVSFTF